MSDLGISLLPDLLSKRTVEGLAEAVSICVLNARDERGLRVAISFSPRQAITMAQQLIDAGIWEAA